MDSPAVRDTDTDTDTDSGGLAGAEPEPAVIELVISGPADAEPARLPDISEYWPDAPHRVGPPAGHYEQEEAEAVRTEPVWMPHGTQRPTVELHLAESRPRRASRKPIVALAAAIVVAGGMAWYTTQPTEPTAGPVLTVPTVTAPAEQPPVSIDASAPVPAAPDRATFELSDGTTALNVRIGDTGDDWFQVTSPNGSGITTRTEVKDSTVRVFVDDGAGPGTAEVNVVLSPDVTWSVLMLGGVRTAAIDLTGAKVGRVDLVGGAAEIALALPRQDAVVPISMTGGVRDWLVSTGGRAPVEAYLERGAGAVDLYGDRKRGVNRGSRFTVGSGDGGIDLVAENGVGTLTVAEAPDGGTIAG